jgi:hypothetical protein
MTAFMVAVGGTLLVSFLLMNRGQARKTWRENADGGWRRWRLTAKIPGISARQRDLAQ